MNEAPRSSEMMDAAADDNRCETSDLTSAAHTLLRLGRLMLVNGAATEAVLDNLTILADRLGFRINLLIFAEGLLLTIQRQGQFETKLGQRVSGAAVNIGALEQLVAICEGRGEPADVEAINRQLNAVEFKPNRYPLWAAVIAMAVTTGSLAWLFGGSAAVIGSSALAGVVNVLVRNRFEAHVMNPIAMTAALALASGGVACLAMKAVPDQSSFLCLVAAGTVLIPGVPLINGMRETLSLQAGAGLPQLTFGLASILAVVTGLLVAAGLAGETMDVMRRSGAPGIAEVILFSGFAGMGFVVLFNVPLRVAWACLVCAAVGHAVRSGLMHGDASLAAGSLAGAMAAAVFARLFAIRFRMPAVAFIFPGIVTLLPAPEAFRTVIGSLQIIKAGAAASQPLVAATLALGLTTLLVVGAIAAGVSIALSAPWKPARRPADTVTGDQPGAL
jgi:uncharacterized membrane protein YjjP (DUF1212 family)